MLKLYRYLDKKYVDAFFDDGSLRLSCFSAFWRHNDAERCDRQEGNVISVYLTQENGGQTILAKGVYGQNAYVLCTSIVCDEDLMKVFGCNSYMTINNPEQFASVIKESIPSCYESFGASCIYQEQRIIQKDIGYIRVEDNELREYLTAQLDRKAFFIKSKSYSHQNEFRFIWSTKESISNYIEIKVPEARKFCSCINK